MALIERARTGEADTAHTTAHLTAVTDMRLSDLVDRFGRNHACAAWDAGAAAIDQIEANVRRESILCDFSRVPGYLHAPVTGKDEVDTKKFRDDVRYANEFGFDAAFIDRVPYMERPGIRFSDQAKFHPIKYLDALTRLIPSDKSYVLEESNAQEFDADKKRARINGHWIKYGLVVLATHNPLVGESGLIGGMMFQTKLALYTSYVVRARIPRDSIPAASFWDTNDPYLYLRIDRGERFDYAILGGEDHKTGQTSDTKSRYANLEAALRKIAPDAEFDHHWSGQVIETNDGLPFIGENDPGQFIATGFSGNGMTFGTLAAMMASDWASQKKNPWTDLLAPSRKTLRGVWDYLKENADYPYYLTKTRLTASEGGSLNEVQPGQGKVLRLNGRKMAVYRDKSGKVTKRSAICTHMGCIVRWNPAESTWDCPCHGSRFRPEGSIISGPAETPLT